jgi:hypothetical protein
MILAARAYLISRRQNYKNTKISRRAKLAAAPGLAEDEFLALPVMMTAEWRSRDGW